MIVFSHKRIVFGTRSDPGPPIFKNLPAGVLKIRIRERNDNIARVFLKFSDRVEEWAIYGNEAGHWLLDYPVGSNRRLLTSVLCPLTSSPPHVLAQ